MNVVKPLAASLLLGLASLTGCGSKDTEQDAEPQPSSPPPPGPSRTLTELQITASPATGYPICRNLKEGDPGYPGWVYCCDNDARTESFWTGANGNRSGMFSGSCYSWGVR